MNTIFDIKRVGMLLRADFIEQKLSLLTYCLTLLVIFSLWINKVSNFIGEPYSFVLFVVSLYYCYWLSKRIHHSKGIYLTLPASNLEKYVTLLIEGLIFLVGFLAMFWCAVALIYLLTGFVPADLNKLNEWSLFPFSVACFFYSLLILANVMFKKYAFPIYILSIGGTVILLSWIISKIVPYIDLNWVKDLMMNMENKEWLITSGRYGYLIFFALTAVIMYVAYIKFTKKQLR